MNNIFYKVIKLVICVSALVVLTGCTYNYFAARVVANESIKRSAWVAYWDLAPGEKDVEKIGNKLDALLYFGAYFDKADRIFIPKELSDKKSELQSKKGRYETYLTFVNDKQNSDGTVVLKDIEVLRRLFSDSASMDKHIDEIIALTLQGGYTGIEIDYERIWKDEKIGLSFLQFADKLYGKALKRNLKLRLVLEPSTPFSSAIFPKGPEYVVMLYNLYGLHSDPGPKANKEFIQKVITRMKALPAERSVAFSTGGCVWGNNGKRSFLTEAEAKSLAVINRAQTKRDPASQCLVFDYKDKDSSYQVWYADVETLNYWIAIAKEQGINAISLWRLGGNVAINNIL